MQYNTGWDIYNWSKCSANVPEVATLGTGFSLASKPLARPYLHKYLGMVLPGLFNYINQANAWLIIIISMRGTALYSESNSPQLSISSFTRNYLGTISQHTGPVDTIFLFHAPGAYLNVDFGISA